MVKGVLKFIDRFSFKQILSASIFLAILLSIPLGVWLVNQQTQLSSRAAIEKSSTVPTPTPFFGPQPAVQPIITQVKPFLGKAGDIVILTGENFGNNPGKRQVWFGNKLTAGKEIISWQNKEIQVLIPAGASSGVIRLVVEPFQATWPKILTVYDRSTRTQVFYRQDSLAVKNISNLKRVLLWDSEDEAKEIILQAPTTVSDEGLSLGFIGKISWVVLFDQNNRPIPFFVNPAEFGF